MGVNVVGFGLIIKLVMVILLFLWRKGEIGCGGGVVIVPRRDLSKRYSPELLRGLFRGRYNGGGGV